MVRIEPKVESPLLRDRAEYKDLAECQQGVQERRAGGGNGMPKRSAQKRFARSLLRPGSSVLAWPPLRAAQGRVGGVRSRANEGSLPFW